MDKKSNKNLTKNEFIACENYEENYNDVMINEAIIDDLKRQESTKKKRSFRFKKKRKKSNTKKNCECEKFKNKEEHKDVECKKECKENEVSTQKTNKSKVKRKRLFKKLLLNKNNKRNEVCNKENEKHCDDCLNRDEFLKNQENEIVWSDENLK